VTDAMIELREINPATTRCRSCGAMIRWATTIAGRPMPVNVGAAQPREIAGRLMVESSATHWATCPNAAAHKKGPKGVG
jgi:membrane-bound ClpP family serine protease